MPEAQSSATLSEGMPDEVPNDVLKPSILIIALAASVLLILFCWYLFILKPALSESNLMDIRLTKMPFSNKLVSPELKVNARVETQITNNDVEPSSEVFENKEKPVVVHRNVPTRHRKSIHRNTPIKSTASNIATSEKLPTAQIHDSPPIKTKEEKDMRADNMKVENIADGEVEGEDTAQKIKSFAVKWKESFLTPSTQPICTQVQIAMNQCPN